MRQKSLKLLQILSFTFYLFLSSVVNAEIEIKLDTTIIKGNTELPKILYIVPWKEITQSQYEEQQLVIHSLYGDLFDPVIPKLSSSQE